MLSVEVIQEINRDEIGTRDSCNCFIRAKIIVHGSPTVLEQVTHFECLGCNAVSYTHLDVYKRQIQGGAGKRENLK